MAKCPLCSRRSAKRQCPAKRTKICPVCCATKREVEIDCPSDCVYLRQGQDYASSAAKDAPTLPAREFSQQFRRKNAFFITAVAQGILEQRFDQPDLLDAEVREALEALKATVRTLGSGIYYETLPEAGSGAMALYRRLRSLLDELMQPQRGGHDALRVGDAPDVVDFVVVSLDLYSGGRPKSRRFLDWLTSTMPEPETRPGPASEKSGLIVP